MHLTVGSSLNCNFLLANELVACDFLRMLLVLAFCSYANVGTCKVESPRWLSLVLRTVGLIGDGETGVRKVGDFGARLVTAGAVGTESASLGLAARASMLTDNLSIWLTVVMRNVQAVLSLSRSEDWARILSLGGAQSSSDEKKQRACRD